MTEILPTNQKLNQWLGPEWISTRPGPSGVKLHYIEGHLAINIANDMFGHDGWSSEIKDSVVDFLDVGTDGRVSLGIATTVRITLKKSNTVHEDIGYGSAENMKGKAAAFEKARKESATDGLKRALRMLGNAMGNCLYDKTYLRNISNMARPQVPFVPKDLYRQEHIRKSMQTETTPASTPKPSSPKPSSPKPSPKVISTPLKKNDKKIDHATTPQEPIQPARTTVPPSSLSKQPTFPTIPSNRQPRLVAAQDEITQEILTIKKESLSAMNSRQPSLLSQDSFGLDSEVEAFMVQYDEDDAMEHIQKSCLSNIYPPSSSSRPSSPSSSSSSRPRSKASQSRKRHRP